MSLPRYEPMLASAWDRPFSDPEWTFEVKWDGVRALLAWDGERTRLYTRTGREATATYPELAAFAGPRPCVLDGEIVAFDSGNRPSFERLQSRMNVAGAARVDEVRAEVPVSYVAFDLLYDGEEIIGLPIEARRERLGGYRLAAPITKQDVVDGDGDAVWQFVLEQDLEGMVAKRRGSLYRPGGRSPEWRKVAHRKTVRAVVAGFTPGEGGRAATFGALLIGMFAGVELRWVGAVGSGFDDAALVAVRRALDEMAVAACPFVPVADLPRAAVWVDPQLVAVVEYKEWTSAGRLRAPVFKGFSDVPAADVTWATEGPERNGSTGR